MKKVLELIEAALKALGESKATGARAESIKAHLESCASNAKAELEPARKEGGFTLLGLLVMVAMIGIMAGLALSARGDSFNATNVLNGYTALQSWPTNTAGTNGLNRLTGGPIFVGNQAQAGFYFTATPMVGITNSSTETVTLIRSYNAGPPVITTDTNGWTTRNDWEGTAALSITFTIPNQTNAWTFMTNLPETFVYGANWVGLYISTNNLNGGVFTNVDYGIVKKIIPIRYP